MENQLEEIQSSAASAQVKDKHAKRVCIRLPPEAKDFALEYITLQQGRKNWKSAAGACLRLCEVFQQRCAFLLRARPDAVSSAARALDALRGAVLRGSRDYWLDMKKELNEADHAQGEIDDGEDGVGSPLAEAALAVPAEGAPAVPVVHAPEQKVMSKFRALQLVYGRGLFSATSN